VTVLPSSIGAKTAYIERGSPWENGYIECFNARLRDELLNGHTEFATVRLRLLKIASRIIEHASRIRIALASCCPEADTFSLVALKLQPSGP
jgi:Transposase DDE domain group 1